MDPILIEFAKGGALVLAFGAMLVFLLRNSNRMGEELKEDKAKVLEAFIRNTEAISGLRNILNERKCLFGDRRVEGLGREHHGE